MASIGEICFAAVDIEELLDFWWRFFSIGLGALIWIVPWALVFYALYFFFSLPLRRRERAQLFLDVVDMGLKQGRSVEHSIIAASQSRDRMLGARFHLLAAYLETGLSLVRALERVPRLLPPQIVAMLKVGGEIGDVRKVLPACRALLKDGIAQVAKGHSYLVVLALVIAPLGANVLTVLAVWVLPKLFEIALTFGSAPPPLLSGLNEHRGLLVSTLAGLQLLFYLGALVYVGGPRLLSWISVGFPFLLDGVFYRIPWKRKRMQRDFSTMLALLLDAGTTEEQAVKLAAESTDNSVFIDRAAKVTEALRSGVKLTEAVERLDDSGEFRWRLQNAVHSRTGFLAALAGWHEALDAKAFQQEQAAAHVVTTAVVLVKGLFVGLIAVSLFQFLIAILNEAVLW